MTRRINIYWLATLLSIPLVIFLFLQFFVHSPMLNSTGNSMTESVLYVSYAHQYLDAENMSLFYSNPFDGDPNSPKIYFQPVNFLIALLIKIGVAPGWALTLFGLVMAWCCIFMGIKIIRHLIPDHKFQTLVVVLFTWGGGLTALGGLIANHFFPNQSYTDFLDGIYTADPAHGWWGLIWGRILFIPLEAYYHFLFLLNIYFLIKKRWGLLLFFSIFLSIAHPFTGIEYLLILLSYFFIEKIILRNKEIPVWVTLGAVAITFFHLSYYLFYLNRFPAHKLLQQQYTVAWTYGLQVALPAYIIVAILALLAIRKQGSIKNLLSNSNSRLFACWAIVSFLLSKHEWFIKPIQPIHFTRGYTWAGLFLLGIPGLLWLLNYLKDKRKYFLRLAFLLLFLSDNGLWFINSMREKNNVEGEGHITNETKEILNFLHKNANENVLIIGNSYLVRYMANMYSSANAWVSHPYNTPAIKKRQAMMETYLTTGNEEPPEWKNRKIYIIMDKEKPIIVKDSLVSNKIFENQRYYIAIP